MRTSLVVAGLLLAFAAVPAFAAQSGVVTNAAGPEQLHGIVVSLAGNVLTLRLRNGQTESVDIQAAQAAHHTGILAKGGAVVVYGSRDAAGTFHAASIGHSSPNEKDWAPDN